MVVNKKLLRRGLASLEAYSWIHKIHKAAVGIAVLLKPIFLLWTSEDLPRRGPPGLISTGIGVDNELNSHFVERW